MPLGTRELYLVLRARDEASRVLRGASANINHLNRQQVDAAQAAMRHGTALASVGVGIAAAGAAGLQFFNNATNAALEYQQEVAKTYTQVDKVGIKMEDISRIGLQVAKDFPVPFEQIQATFYDIFSSINVNATQSEVLLRAFAKAAVAGQSDMQTAGRATIAVLNAYKIPAEKVNDVNDVMFKLVQKGVGTYEEFTSVIGRAIPSSVRAGQSFQDLAGMMAFLTRNGLSTAMAATSAARALDSMSHPKTVERMEELGIKVRNAKGEFLPMIDVVEQLSKKLGSMTAPERASALQELFKGSGGTIQARRFWDTALKQPEALRQFTTDMKNAAGATQQAYEVMAEAPLSKIQQLQNRYQAVRIEIGQKLLPIKLKLVEALSKLLTAWDKLGPGTQKIIVLVAAGTSAFMVLAGILLTVVGGLMMLSAAATLLGVGLGTIVAISAGVAAAIIAIGAAIYFIIKYHEEIWDWIKKVWGNFVKLIQPVIDGIVAFGEKLLNVVMPAFRSFWKSIVENGQKAWKAIKDGLNSISEAWNYFTDLLDAGKFDGAIEGLKNLWSIIWGLAQMIGVTLAAAFGLIVDVVGAVLGPAIGFIGEAFKALMNIISGFVQLFLALVTGDLKGAGEALKKIFLGALQAVGAAFEFLIKSVIGIVKALVNGVINFFKGLWDTLVGHSIIPDMVKAILKWILDLQVKFALYIAQLVGKVIDWFKTLPGKTWDAIKSMSQKLYDIGKQSFDQLQNAITTGAGKVITYVTGIPARILSALGKVKDLLYTAGQDIFGGLKRGMEKAAETVVSAGRTIASKLVSAVKSFFGIRSPSTVMAGIGDNIMRGLFNGILNNTTNINKVFGKVFGGIKGGFTSFVSNMSKFGSKFLDMVGFSMDDLLGAGGGGKIGGKVGGASGSNVNIVRAVANQLGWGGGAMWNALYKLIMGESGFRNTAQNPTSTAYGMFQFLNSTWGTVGGHKTSDPYLQAVYGLRYIQSRYGNPLNAYAKWSSRSPHWYAEGGEIREPVVGVGARSGDPYVFGERGVETVIPGRLRTGPAKQCIHNHFDIDVYTQEIDPRKHAADLGFEIARRMGY